MCISAQIDKVKALLSSATDAVVAATAQSFYISVDTITYTLPFIDVALLSSPVSAVVAAMVYFFSVHTDAVAHHTIATIVIGAVLSFPLHRDNIAAVLFFSCAISVETAVSVVLSSFVCADDCASFLFSNVCSDVAAIFNSFVLLPLNGGPFIVSP